MAENILLEPLGARDSRAVGAASTVAAAAARETKRPNILKDETETKDSEYPLTPCSPYIAALNGLSARGRLSQTQKPSR